MATAVEPSSGPRAPGQPLGLPVASLLGALYCVAVLAIVFYALPHLWKDYVLGGGEESTNMFGVRVIAQAIGLAGLGFFGALLVGSAPVKGIRGGIFLMLVAAFFIFFITRWVALMFEGTMGLLFTVVVLIGLLALAGVFFVGARGERWMVGLEEQGWFSIAQYKRSLGLRVRRLTILGILLIGGSGVYSLYFQGIIPHTWILRMPFGWAPITVMTDAHLVIPGVLLLATLWIAFRAVNLPTFAEFLIATEAEMNKVSWSTRKRLGQDTVVVLITTLIMTLFLLVVDLFWGWLLSRQTVGVLPSRSTGGEKMQVQEAKW